MKQKQIFRKIGLFFTPLLGIVFIVSCGIYDVCDETDHREARNTNYSVSKSFSELVKRQKIWDKNQNEPSYANVEPETGKTLRLLEGIPLR